jgi:hypothetical protein
MTTHSVPGSVRPGRNRIIAITAGLITVLAVVLSFASGYLGLGWQWLRPAAELLLLAELVGLIVLERHQLFEPVHEKVGGIEAQVAAIGETLSRAGLSDIRASLGHLMEQMEASGQVSLCATPPDVLQTITRVAREALAHDQRSPQILRSAYLSGRMFAEQQWSLADHLRDAFDVVSGYMLLSTSPPDARARRWSIRMLMVIGRPQF